jgi:hypothetical protein
MIATMPDKSHLGPESQELRASLSELIPGVENLQSEEFKTLAGLMRRQVLLEHQEERTAQNILEVGDWQALKKLAFDLPFNNLKEISTLIDELALEPEESENETLNWAFRHQSLGGDLLADEVLIPFKLIRLKEHAYILLCQEYSQKIFVSFSKVFGKEPTVTTLNAIKVSGCPWVGFAWFLDPDIQAAQAEADNLRAIWERA